MLLGTSQYLSPGVGQKNFRGGSLEIGLRKGGVYSLEDFVEGGGGSKNTYCPVEFAILVSNVS